MIELDFHELRKRSNLLRPKKMKDFDIGIGINSWKFWASNSSKLFLKNNHLTYTFIILN